MSPTREPASAGAWVPVVGIGASAGGLEALQQFFRTVADDIGLAYVVIVHLAPDRESELASILARETSMPVTQVVDHERAELEADHVYVIAPNRKLEVVDGAVGASRFEEPRGQRSAVDLFFRSLADARGDIFAVILSGGGTDGAVGAKSVKEAGGLVLVQDPREASHNSMPRAAVATGVADLVLPVRELAGRLAELVHNRAHLARLVAPREGEAPIDGDGDVPTDGRGQDRKGPAVRTLAEAQERARGYAARFDNVAGFRLNSGWYALALGPYDVAGKGERVAAWLNEAPSNRHTPSTGSPSGRHAGGGLTRLHELHAGSGRALVTTRKPLAPTSSAVRR